jgi:type IV secretion system pilin
VDFLSISPLAQFASASAAADAMQSYITPILGMLTGLASLAVVFFLIYGGIRYMTSTGNPERLEEAKKILKNALIGLAVVIAAGTLTAILSHAYTAESGPVAQQLPEMTAIEPESGGITEVLLTAITGLLKNVIQTIGKPFIDALGYFTEATPLMADNSSVFNLWLVIIGITNVLFVLIVTLLGFHVMSASAFGFDEIEFKHLLPQLGLVFLLINSSIFIIDAIIGLSNGMIKALHAGFPDTTVWNSLLSIVDESGGFGLGALLIMIVFIILAVMLVVYYVLRIVILYIGAVLAPILLLLWLLPAFKDFAVTAMRVYLTTIFVLFVHVVILMLASSIFVGMDVASPDGVLNPIMAMIVGVATMLALLKTQAVMSQMSYVSLGPRTARKLGGQLANVIKHYGDKSSRKKNNSGNNSDSRGRQGGIDNFYPARNRTQPGPVVVTRQAPRAVKRGSTKPTTGTTRVAPQSTTQDTTKPSSSKRLAAPSKPPRTRVSPSIRKESKK